MVHRLSIEDCRKYINGDEHLTDAHIKELAEQLYVIAEVACSLDVGRARQRLALGWRRDEKGSTAAGEAGD